MSEKIICGSNVNVNGFYCCCNCGQKIYLNEGQSLPPCPRCTNQTFEKETEENKDYYDEKNRIYEEKNS